MIRITAAVLEERGRPFALRELALPPPGPGEVLVRVRAAGVCHTDLAVAAVDLGQALPIVLGHEGAGEVEAVGEGVVGLAPGDRVALSYASCRACAPCGEGAPQYCDRWAELNWLGRPLFGNGVNGGFFGQSTFATHALAHVSNTVPIGPDLPFELAAPLGCGMQTGAGAVLNALRPRAGRSLAVYGVGSVGSAALMTAADAGCAPLIAIDRNPARLALARELGATDAIGAVDDLVAAVHRVAPAGVDFAIETTGAPPVIRAATEALAVRGTCMLLAVTGPMPAEFTPGALLAGRTVRGCVEGDADPLTFIPELIARQSAGRFPVERLVETYPLAAINEAAADMAAGRVVKPVLLM